VAGGARSGRVPDTQSERVRMEERPWHAVQRHDGQVRCTHSFNFGALNAQVSKEFAETSKLSLRLKRD
jgi:hypothetical protein